MFGGYNKLMSSYVRGLCDCGNRQESKGINKQTGKRVYSRYCSSCKKQKNQRNSLIKANAVCSVCSFIPQHPSQLDIDHIDGDHTNNSILNLQILCANCHRLKTYLNEDWKS